MNRILNTDGLVIPVTTEDINLLAYLENGNIIWGESSIGKRTGTERIDRIELRPSNPPSVPEAVKKILEADIILLGPGSLYTSIIPNLLVDGITDAITKSKATKIYVCNLMTQPGETIGYTAHDHLAAIEKHTYAGFMDYIIANDEAVNSEILDAYALEGSECVKINDYEFDGTKTILKSGALADDTGKVLRHDVNELVKIILECAK